MENVEKKCVIEGKNLKLKIVSKETSINYGDFNIYSGDFITIEGANGSGKTTFLKLISNEVGYCEIVTGDILINGINLLDYDVCELRRKTVVNIEQEDNFLKHESTYKALIRPAINSLVGLQNKLEIKKKIQELAFEFYRKYLFKIFNEHQNSEIIINRHLKNPKSDFKFMYHSVSKLSGGQKKIVHILQGILKVMTIGCSILLLDEPLNNLDKDNKKILLKLIKEIRENNPNLVILLITHCKLFPGVRTTLRINSGINLNYAELIRYSEDLKPYDCLD